MGNMEFIAFGGLERLAIIAGAIFIGYWGYQIYGKARPAGLAFLTIACGVLIATLLTSGNHQRSIASNLQLASATAPTAATLDGLTDDQQPTAEEALAPTATDSPWAQAGIASANPKAPSRPATAERPGAPGPQTAANPDDAAVTSPGASPAGASPAGASPSDTLSAGTLPVGTLPPAATTGESEQDTTSVAGLDTEIPKLATGQELGGRIVSIRSKNVTLEWSDDRQPVRVQ